MRGVGDRPPRRVLGAVGRVGTDHVKGGTGAFQDKPALVEALALRYWDELEDLVRGVAGLPSPCGSAAGAPGTRPCPTSSATGSTRAPTPSPRATRCPRACFSTRPPACRCAASPSPVRTSRSPMASRSRPMTRAGGCCFWTAPAAGSRLDPSTGVQTRYARVPDLPLCSADPPGAPCSPALMDQPPMPDYAVGGPDGSLYVTDYQHAVIWRIPPGGGTPQLCDRGRRRTRVPAPAAGERAGW